MEKGFTLAEVLITLGIIGIVAAMTMPALVGKYKKVQTVAQLKKVYSSLLQSVEFSKSQYGDIKNWDWNLEAADFYKKYLGKYLKTTAVCEDTDTSICWGGNKTKTLNGSYFTGDNKQISFKLADGTIIRLEKQNDLHIHLWVDINGQKEPNTFGRDIFVLTMVGDAFKDDYQIIPRAGLYMFGHGLTREEVRTTNSQACTKTKRGTTCGELILMDGWEIKDDYPW